MREETCNTYKSVRNSNHIENKKINRYFVKDNIQMSNKAEKMFNFFYNQRNAN